MRLPRSVPGQRAAGEAADPDEFVAVTGYHRKHAVRILNGGVLAVEARVIEAGGRPRLYDEAIREALIVLWEASDRVCGKRLKPLLPVLDGGSGEARPSSSA